MITILLHPHYVVHACKNQTKMLSSICCRVFGGYTWACYKVLPKSETLPSIDLHLACSAPQSHAGFVIVATGNSCAGVLHDAADRKVLKCTHSQIYMHKDTKTSTYIHTCTFTHTRIYTPTHCCSYYDLKSCGSTMLSISNSRHIQTHKHTYTHTHTSACTHPPTTHPPTHTHTHTHRCGHTHTNTHTHTKNTHTHMVHTNGTLFCLLRTALLGLCIVLQVGKSPYTETQRKHVHMLQLLETAVVWFYTSHRRLVRIFGW